MIRATIDGKNFSFPDGKNVREASHAAGIEIPALCDDQRLKPCGACRVCLVEINGWSRPVVSCMTELKDGMEIQTNSGELTAARKMNLRMLARKYPVRSFIQFPDKPFHKLAREHGLVADDF